MAPQLLRGDPFYGVDADIFSLGVCLFVMVTGDYPFGCADPNQDPAYARLVSRDENEIFTFWAEVEAKSKEWYSAKFKTLLTIMFQFDPADRLSLAELRNDAWIKGKVASIEDVK